jgi:TRAP-type C4-dicarboxylate transport system permease small subunit
MSDHLEVSEDGAVHRIVVPTAGMSPIDFGCEVVCSLLLLAMIVMIGAEAIARNVFGTSLQVTDEVGGYLLVALTFLSMSIAESQGAFHRVEFVQMRLSPRMRILSQIVFELMSLAATALVTWQLIRLGLNSYHSEDVAPTPLATPLWMPQTSMGLGMALLCLALLRTIIAKIRVLRAQDLESGALR